MGFTLTAQAEGFAASLLLGFSLALLYDLLRAVRLRRRERALLTGALDALYCVIFALLVFLFSMRVGGGELRLYMILAALLGALFYFSLCARLLRPLWDLWAGVLFSLSYPSRCARRDGLMVNLPNFAKDTFFFPESGL